MSNFIVKALKKFLLEIEPEVAKIENVAPIVEPTEVAVETALESNEPIEATNENVQAEPSVNTELTDEVVELSVVTEVVEVDLKEVENVKLQAQIVSLTEELSLVKAEKEKYEALYNTSVNINLKSTSETLSQKELVKKMLTVNKK